MQEVQAEGRHAIDSPGNPNNPEIPPEDYALREFTFSISQVWLTLNSLEKYFFLGDNEQRAIIQPQSLADPQVQELQQVLIDWINDELANQRIIVKNIEEDLYDGQVLHKLWENLTGRKLDVLEVTQSEEGQREKLSIVLNAVNHVSSSLNGFDSNLLIFWFIVTAVFWGHFPHLLVLINYYQINLTDHVPYEPFPHEYLIVIGRQVLGFHHKIPKWSVESVHSKNMVAILHLLVALVRHFRAPIRLPENVFVTIVIAQKNGQVLSAQ